MQLARQGEAFPLKIDEKEHKIMELADTIVALDDELTLLKDIVLAKRWNATEFEQEHILYTVKELRNQIKILELDNQSLRDSRDMFQNRNAEIIRSYNSLKRQLKK
jgi:hypothetical protein